MRDLEQQPLFLAPMLASSGPVPGGQAWALEIKWDGCRVQLHHDGRSISLRTRNRRECSAHFPELAEIGGALGTRRGHIVTTCRAPLPPCAAHMLQTPERAGAF